jgi:hypothetical protein
MAGKIVDILANPNATRTLYDCQCIGAMRIFSRFLRVCRPSDLSKGLEVPSIASSDGQEWIDGDAVEGQRCAIGASRILSALDTAAYVMEAS